jgi:predicted nucleotidyltransferase
MPKGAGETAVSWLGYDGFSAPDSCGSYAMIALITDNQAAIAALCREFGIRKLEVFGSAASGRFDPESSDVDLIVDLGGYERGVAKRFMRFARALETLLGRTVDVITDEQIRNPYFRQAVDEQRVTIYESRDREAAA